MRRSVVVCALFLLGGTAEAHAEPLTVAVEGPVRVESSAGKTSCTGPCSVDVPAGFVHVHTEKASRELYVEGPSRVTLAAGNPGLRTAGAVALVAGIAVVAAAIAVPLIVCRPGPYRFDASGRRVQDPGPCEDIDDGVKVAWIGGAGVGLTAAIAGGIVFALSGPRLRLVDANGAHAPRERQAGDVRLTPWSAPSGHDGGRPAGVAITITF